jgi:hypothetical protein
VDRHTGIGLTISSPVISDPYVWIGSALTLPDPEPCAARCASVRHLRWSEVPQHWVGADQRELHYRSHLIDAEWDIDRPPNPAGQAWRASRRLGRCPRQPAPAPWHCSSLSRVLLSRISAASRASLGEPRAMLHVLHQQTCDISSPSSPDTLAQDGCRSGVWDPPSRRHRFPSSFGD